MGEKSGTRNKYQENGTLIAQSQKNLGAATVGCVNFFSNFADFWCIS